MTIHSAAQAATNAEKSSCLEGLDVGEITLEVLAERVNNVSKKLDEQVALSKASAESVLTAISVAKVDQERTVTVAFAASSTAIGKTEDSQKESSRTIGVMQNDITRLKESQASSSGSGIGMREMAGWVFGALMFLVNCYLAFHK
jgi:hypothetical protein